MMSVYPKCNDTLCDNTLSHREVSYTTTCTVYYTIPRLCNGTEVTTHTSQNNHLFFAVAQYGVMHVISSLVRNAMHDSSKTNILEHYNAIMVMSTRLQPVLGKPLMVCRRHPYI